MQVNGINFKSQAFFKANQQTKKVEKSTDEFQARLNEIKNQEKKSEKQNSFFVNKDLDLSKTLKDFKNYGTSKVIQDRQKENEATLLNKLFAMVDANVRGSKI